LEVGSLGHFMGVGLSVSEFPLTGEGR
jgi:hypothetical protein